MNRFSILIVEFIILAGLMILRIYLHIRRMKKVKCIEMQKSNKD